MSKFKPLQDDVIIAVMGPTGSGKTNFINTLTGIPEKPKAASLRSATQNVTPYTIMRNSRRVVLVDTPGFDDTFRPDLEILKIIADWLTKKYPGGDTLRVAGIIYLHRITDNRMSATAYKNLQIFGRLCGNVPLQRARLVTTMWDEVPGRLQKFEDREEELIREFWRPLIDEGAHARRFENTTSSAFQIVDELIATESAGDDLLLQEELVKQQKHLNETEAGKILYSRLQKLLLEHKSTLMGLADEAKLQNDPDLAKSLQEEYERINVQLQKTFEEMKVMKVSLPRRVLLWLFTRRSHGKAVKLDDEELSALSRKRCGDSGESHIATSAVLTRVYGI